MVIDDKPTGLSANSPSVNRSKLPTSHMGDTNVPGWFTTWLAATIIKPNPAAANNMPKANFVILLGSSPLFANLTQITLTMGASNKIKNGFKD